MTIQINLIPESLRKRRKSSGFPVKSFLLPREVVIGLVGGLVGFLVFFHVMLQLVITVRFVQLFQYRRGIERLATKKQEAEGVLQQLRQLQSNITMIDGVSNTKKIYWSAKLNAISDSLTRGVWLEKISWENGTFLLRGSAVSKSAAEMIAVNNFVTKLKGNAVFTRDLGRIETGQIKTRKVNLTPVADFSLTAQAK
jgi:Tfp pilus assembly protein PilN